MLRQSHAAPRLARVAARLISRVGPSRLVPVLLALTILPLAAGVADASGTNFTANCGANLRSRPTTTSSIRKTIAADTVITAVSTVRAGWYKADCAGYVSGDAWFKITAIGGRSVSSLFGVSYVYGATRLFRASATGYTYGIDISHWNGSVDFAKVKAAGRHFVIAKATEGNTITDSMYAHNEAAAMAAGLKFTGYHYARPSSVSGDATNEADHFVSVLGLKRGMLTPVLDLEVTGGLSVSGLQGWVKTFLGRVYARTGVKAMIYTNGSFWQTAMGNTSWFAANGYRIWIAHWATSSPSVPASNWGGRSWTFWQYSDCGKVSGVSGCVDLDRFTGSNFAAVTW